MSDQRNFDVWNDGKTHAKAWVRGVPVEPDAQAQVMRVAALPFIHHHVAVMPDVHVGKGATIGTVIATHGAIIPAAVGVDLGCGMSAVMTNLTASHLPDSLAMLRSTIEAVVPHGRTHNGGPGDVGARAQQTAAANTEWSELDHGFRVITDAHPAIAKSNNLNHLGTLGTGNHFIEVCLDETDRVWVMLHSGSRGVGGRIGSYFIAKAKEEMKRWYINLPDVDLAYLPEGSDLFNDYMMAVGWAQSFAHANRRLMMRATLEQLGYACGLGLHNPPPAFSAVVDCHHNYVAREKHFGESVLVTRKGAVRAREGDMGIIPGSMGAKSYIVRGKGNRDSFDSCSHGAGRAMSRTEAKRRFTVEDHVAATVGVECRKDADVVDETPAAYKSIDAVMAAQTDLVDVVHTLRAVLCVKG